MPRRLDRQLVCGVDEGSLGEIGGTVMVWRSEYASLSFLVRRRLTKAVDASLVETGLPVKLSLVTRKGYEGYALSAGLGQRDVKHTTTIPGMW